MEKDKALTKEEAAQVVGGNSAEPSFSVQPTVFCPRCNKCNVSIKSFSINENNEVINLYHCNYCDHEWEAKAKPIFPGYSPNPD